MLSIQARLVPRPLPQICRKKVKRCHGWHIGLAQVRRILSRFDAIGIAYRQSDPQIPSTREPAAHVSVQVGRQAYSTTSQPAAPH